MAGPRLTALKLQWDEAKTAIDTINRSAEDEKRGLTEQEQADLDQLHNRCAELEPKITTEAENEQRLASVSDVLARVGIQVPTPPVQRAASEAPELTAGEYFSAFLQAHHDRGTSNPEEFLERAARYIDRKALDRAQQSTADTAGVLPTPIVGDLIKLADTRRPAFSALTARPMPPSGKTFTRPRVTQQVAVAATAEGVAGASQKMTIAGDTVTKLTYRGFLDLSMEDVDWTTPEALDLAIQDFIDVYAVYSDTQAAANLVTNSTDGGVGSWDGTSVTTINTKIMAGVSAVYGRVKRFPDTAFLSLDRAIEIASKLTTNEQRTAFDVLNETLRNIVPNWRWVVDPNFAAATVLLSATSLTESYEQRKGLLRVDLPNTFEARIAYAAYVAFYNPPAAAFPTQRLRV